MKLKRKGPSPETDALSAFKILPAAILVLAALLSPADREVLAYLISRSLKTTTHHSSKKKNQKKLDAGCAAAQPHRPARFDCDCFDCYTSYWFRWDSSPNRELINQAIEAFEDHLAAGEKSKKTAGGKRRDKNGRRVTPAEDLVDVPVSSTSPEVSSSGFAEVIPVVEVSPEKLASPERSKEVESEVVGDLQETAATAADTARKLMPDVLGTIKSRIWGLWNPNV